MPSTSSASTTQRSLLLASAIAALGVVWTSFALLVVPPVIQRAYRGESSALLNEIISGQQLFPVEHYLHLWTAVTWRVSTLLFVVASLVLIASRPGARRLSDRLLGRFVRAGSSVPDALLTPRRLLLINTVIIVVLASSALSLITDIEFWPFSPYRMYAEPLHGPSLTRLRLYGVMQARDSAEIALVADDYIQPFNQRLLESAFETLARDPRRQGLLERALRDCLARYERLRAAHRHGGPPLAGVRLYRTTWRVEPGVSKVDEPDRKDLVMEILGTSEP